MDLLNHPTLEPVLLLAEGPDVGSFPAGPVFGASLTNPGNVVPRPIFPFLSHWNS